MSPTHISCLRTLSPRLGLNLLLELLRNVHNSDLAVAFYQAYYIPILQDLFYVLTDTFHKPGPCSLPPRPFSLRTRHPPMPSTSPPPPPPSHLGTRGATMSGYSHPPPIHLPLSAQALSYTRRSSCLCSALSASTKSPPRWPHIPRLCPPAQRTRSVFLSLAVCALSGSLVRSLVHRRALIASHNFALFPLLG